VKTSRKNNMRCGLVLVLAMSIITIMILYMGSLGYTVLGFDALSFVVLVWGVCGFFAFLGIRKRERKHC